MKRFHSSSLFGLALAALIFAFIAPVSYDKTVFLVAVLLFVASPFGR